MKAILVLDEMPNKCNECPFHILVDEKHFVYDNRLICYPYDVIHKKIKTTEWDADRPSWCPLKEMPKRKEYYIDEVCGDMYDRTDSAYVNGWNACLEEIEK